MSITRWVAAGIMVCGVAAAATVPVVASRDWDTHQLSLEVKCAAGKAESCTLLGLAYLGDTGAAGDAARASSFFQRGCTGGDAEGCVEQAVLLLDGTGVEEDAARAASLLGEPCDTGSARACSLLGWVYEQGRGVERDRTRAASLYQRACDRDFPRACTQLGELLASGSDTVKADGKRALQLFDRACKAGDSLACRREAQAYECGRAVQADPSRATERYFAACSAGDEASCEWLASRHSEESTHLDRFASEPGFQFLQLRAAIEAARFGRRGRAEMLLRRVEGDDPELKPQVAFVRACLSLDAGDVAGADALLQGLPDDPALRVLQRLLAQRRGGATRWTSALASAWVEEGRPDLRASLFLSSAREQEEDLGACSAPHERRQSPPGMEARTAFLLEYSDTLAHDMNAPVGEAMLTQALTWAGDARTELRVVALELLTRPSLTEAQRQKAHPVAALQLARLAEEHPGNLFFQLWAALGPEAEAPPLTEALVDRLEALAALTFEPPLHEVYGAFSSAEAQAGESRGAAFGAAVSVMLAPRYTDAATRWEAQARKAEPALRLRLGQVLMSLGGRIAEGGWMVHVFQGSSVMARGAALTGKPVDAEAAAAMSKRGRGFLDGSRSMRAMGSWPLAAFTSEWLDRVATEELTFFTELSQQGAW